jgi:hypothetical protein
MAALTWCHDMNLDILGCERLIIFFKANVGKNVWRSKVS